MLKDKINTLLELKKRVQEKGTISDLYIERAKDGSCKFCAVGHLLVIKGVDIKSIENTCNGDNVHSLPSSILDTLEQAGFGEMELDILQSINDTTVDDARDAEVIHWIDVTITQIKQELEEEF